MFKYFLLVLSLASSLAGWNEDGKPISYVEVNSLRQKALAPVLIDNWPYFGPNAFKSPDILNAYYVQYKGASQRDYRACNQIGQMYLTGEQYFTRYTDSGTMFLFDAYIDNPNRIYGISTTSILKIKPNPQEASLWFNASAQYYASGSNYVEIAQIFEEAGHWNEAQPWYELASISKHSESMREAARAFAAHGLKDKATQAYERAGRQSEDYEFIAKIAYAFSEGKDVYNKRSWGDTQHRDVEKNPRLAVLLYLRAIEVKRNMRYPRYYDRDVDEKWYEKVIEIILNTKSLHQEWFRNGTLEKVAHRSNDLRQMFEEMKQIAAEQEKQKAEADALRTKREAETAAEREKQRIHAEQARARADAERAKKLAEMQRIRAEAEAKAAAEEALLAAAKRQAAAARKARLHEQIDKHAARILNARGKHVKSKVVLSSTDRNVLPRRKP